MRIERTIADLRAALEPSRRGGGRIGLVPTMGSFHDGHVSLMRRARESCDVVVVSLFVNPAQFNDQADLDAYPRDEGRDAAIAADAGVDLIFAPTAEEMYPPGFATTVSVGAVALPLEGVARGPRHFQGVATVVTKLLHIVQPHVAVFGQKDAQQALVIRRLVRDLDLPVSIEVAPTIREADGLAMSSRNVRLDPARRAQALALYRALVVARDAIAGGTRDRRAVEEAGLATLRAAGIDPEYLAVVDAESLAPTEVLQGGRELLVAVAARVGDVRLIDNELVRVP